MAASRPYVPDTIAAFFSGIGSATGYYDANGQYARGGVTVSGTPSELTGLMSIIGGSGAGLTLSGARTGLTAACPGGGDPAAADGSNPWSSPDTLPATGQLCDPADDAH